MSGEKSKSKRKNLRITLTMAPIKSGLKTSGVIELVMIGLWLLGFVLQEIGRESVPFVFSSPLVAFIVAAVATFFYYSGKQEFAGKFLLWAIGAMLVVLGLEWLGGSLMRVSLIMFLVILATAVVSIGAQGAIVFHSNHPLAFKLCVWILATCTVLAAITVIYLEWGVITHSVFQWVSDLF